MEPLKPCPGCGKNPSLLPDDEADGNPVVCDTRGCIVNAISEFGGYTIEEWNRYLRPETAVEKMADTEMLVRELRGLSQAIYEVGASNLSQRLPQPWYDDLVTQELGRREAARKEA